MGTPPKSLSNIQTLGRPKTKQPVVPLKGKSLVFAQPTPIARSNFVVGPTPAICAARRIRVYVRFRIRLQSM